ncbi:MAG TPA: hypothetical protein VEY10_19110 [Flavisolibacter sp.]|nr:hypothetical protein [Flavisolibacter sp.]
MRQRQVHRKLLMWLWQGRAGRDGCPCARQCRCKLLKPNAASLFDLTKHSSKTEKANKILEREKEEASTIDTVKNILAHYPDYTVKKSAYGDVIVGVPNETVNVIYNTPNTLASVFPGEEHGIHLPKATYAITVNTYRNHQSEGGNDLVFLNLQAARLGILDLEKFKRQINYCLLPNGTCTDLSLQAHGRYHDGPFNFGARMGIWF